MGLRAKKCSFTGSDNSVHMRTLSASTTTFLPIYQIIYLKQINYVLRINLLLECVDFSGSGQLNFPSSALFFQWVCRYYIPVLPIEGNDSTEALAMLRKNAEL